MEFPWLKSYPKDVPYKIDLTRYANVLDVFNEACSKFRDRPAVYNGVAGIGNTLSYHDLDRLTGQFASFLQHELKMQKGDRIAIQMPNCLQFPIALFGALRAGLIVVNTNPLYTAREMEHQFNDSGAKAVVIFANYAHLLEEVKPKTKVEHVVVTELGDLFGFGKSNLVNFLVKYVKKMVPPYHLPQAFSFNQALEIGARKPFQEVRPQSGDIAFLQYTGGTTGISKGAMLTHANIVANMSQIYYWMKPSLKEGEEIIVTALPMYHIFSLTVNCMTFMSYGAKNILITNPRDIPGFIKELKSHPFTVVTGVNTLFNALMHHKDFDSIDFSKVKINVAGGMALQKAVAEKWMERTKTRLVEGYGLTETSPVACVNPINGGDKVGTIGLPLPNTEIRLLDDNEKEVGPGESGEIAIRGPQVMKGYWNKPEETEKVMTKDGFFKSGDIGVIDSDGYFKIVDRKKDMILVSGFNVYPNEVEDVIATHPGVLEVAAIGIPDEKSGEAVKVVIVKKDQALTSEDIIGHCRDRLTNYKCPKKVEFRTELPKTNVGKILRRALRENTASN